MAVSDSLTAVWTHCPTGFTCPIAPAAEAAGPHFAASAYGVISYNTFSWIRHTALISLTPTGLGLATYKSVLTTNTTRILRSIHPVQIHIIVTLCSDPWPLCPIPTQFCASPSFFFCIHILHIHSWFNSHIPVAVMFSFPLPLIRMGFIRNCSLYLIVQCTVSGRRNFQTLG